MTAYNPDEVDRLVREAREDDERMDIAPWGVDVDVVHSGSGVSLTERLGEAEAYAIARTRNNLSAMADQLEAARTRIAEQDRDLAEARRDVMLQAARLAALESELATLKASVINALSSAGPEVPEDERTT